MTLDAWARPPSPARRSGGRPGTGRWDRRTPARPAVGHLEQRPARSVAPKRCLTARSRRRAWWRSPSKASTVSTTCSSTRGPGEVPSLVTWPTSRTAMPRRLGLLDQPVSALPDLGDRARRRAELGIDDGLDRVDDHDVGPQVVDRGSTMSGSAVSARSQSSRRSAPSRSAREPHLLRLLLGGHVERAAAPPRPARGQACSSSVDLPMPGSPPSRVTEPGTRPPPSTRSSSAMPVGTGAARRATSSAVMGTAGRRAGAGSAPGAPATHLDVLDERVPAAAGGAAAGPLAATAPHSLHRWIVFNFVAMPGTLKRGCHRDGEFWARRVPAAAPPEQEGDDEGDEHEGAQVDAERSPRQAGRPASVARRA